VFSFCVEKVKLVTFRVNGKICGIRNFPPVFWNSFPSHSDGLPLLDLYHEKI
jgi:hypothetical protein